MAGENEVRGKTLKNFVSNVLKKTYWNLIKMVAKILNVFNVSKYIHSRVNTALSLAKDLEFAWGSEGGKGFSLQVIMKWSKKGFLKMGWGRVCNIKCGWVWLIVLLLVISLSLTSPGHVLFLWNVDLLEHVFILDTYFIKIEILIQ